jgi:epoxyqueuosine reductase
VRPLIGNRIYGCDDCQLVCPWNRYARLAGEPDFARGNGLDAASLDDAVRLGRSRTSSPAPRARRSAASATCAGCATSLIALGNAPSAPAIIAALSSRQDDPSPMLREHVAWALARHRASTG